MLSLEVLSPRSLLFSGDVANVTLPATLGEMCVLPGHVSFVSGMNYGVLRFPAKDGIKKIAVHQGIFYVNADKVVVMADRGEMFDHIDINRAKLAEENARKKLDELRKNNESDSVISKFEAKLWRALNRLGSQ